MYSESTNLSSVGAHKPEAKSPSERCLSPVLNSNNPDRKNIYKRMKGKMKSRVNLCNRFSTPNSENSVDLNKTISELQEINTKDTTTRLVKIKELDEIKRKLLEDLYVQQAKSEVKPDEFKFKKPFVPAQKCKILRDEISPEKPNQTGGNIKEGTIHFQGFRTGSGKGITISPELLKKHSKVFEGVLNIDNEYVEGIQHSLSIGALKEIKTSNESSKRKEGRDPINADLFFMQTSLSDTQMIAAADIIESEMRISTTMICEKEDSSSNKNEKDTAMSCEDLCSKTTAENLKNCENEQFNGFSVSEYELAVQIHSTLSKIIEIMDNTSKNHKHFLEEENIEPSSKRFKFDPEISKNNFSNFKRKPLTNNPMLGDQNVYKNTQKSPDLRTKVSVNGMESNKVDEATINQDLIPLDTFQNETFNSGFRTASNKPLKMKPEALDNAKKLFDSCESDFIKEKDNFQNKIINNVHSRGFSTAGGKPLKVSTNALRKANCLFTDENLSFGDFNNENVSSSSGAAMKRSESLFKEDGSNEINPARNHQRKSSKVWGPGVRSVGNTGIDFNEIAENIPSGFTTGSGAKIVISKEALQKSEFLFTDDSNSLEITKPVRNNEKGLQRPGRPLGNTKHLEVFNKIVAKIPSGFTTGSGAKINISKEALQKSEFLLKDDSKSLEIIKPARNNQNNISKSIQRPGRPFGNAEDLEEFNKIVAKIPSDFTTGSGAKINISKEALQKSEFLLKEDSELNQTSSMASISNRKMLSKGFVTAGGKSLEISNNALSKAKALFTSEEFSLTANLNQDNETKIMGVGNFEENMSTSDTLKNSTVISREEERRKEAVELKKDIFKSISNLASPKLDSPFRPRRKLGVSACKQIRIPDQKLQGAKSFFEEDLNALNTSITPNKILEGLTPLKEDLNTSNRSANSINTPNKIIPRIHSSTPVKESQVGNTSTPLRESVLEKSKVRIESLDNTNLTPVKRLCVENREEEEANGNDDFRVVFKEENEGNIEERLGKLDEEYKRLVKQMKVVEERKVLLRNQQDIIKTNNPLHRRPKACSLTIKRQFGKKMSLLEFCKGRQPSPSSTTSKKLFAISPENATKVHFNCDSDQQSVETQDGAFVIPNVNNLIGLSEIRTAFEAMPGVDPTLLPRGWICNHFKWIVWKLASLERSFPDVFPECLCVENVIQQLKYRYDREIDKAERPALRRILEKDDVPQKRMVLCVSDIIKVSSVAFELELTDGWYSIRTLIDSPLCNEILKRKIVIGTKLIVQYAEILNCDGYHPLETPNHVKLKINYNCTRRAAWHAKLGYQKIAEPFPVSLNTVQSEGGLIACAKVHIVRAYPLKYMERLAGRRIWRNIKAEEKRAQDWMKEKMNQVEQLQRKVEEDYFKEHREVDVQLDGDCKISEINCAKTLCNILENAKDPEGLKREMTSSQMESVLMYKENLNSHHQQEISARINRDIIKLKKEQRDVVSILQLRMVDASRMSNESYLFTIWKPKEEQIEVLKEGHSFTIYNILPRANGDITATVRTHFKFNPTIPQEFSELKRYLVPIDVSCFKRPLFDEFDTVGTVVQIHVHLNQELWLAGSSGSLLHIRIRETPNHCCLLDNLNRGDHVAVMNLIFCSHDNSFLEALANQCTVITTYPRQSFLQEGLNSHISSLPKDLDVVLNEGDRKIEEYLKMKQTSGMKSSNYFDESFEESTLVASRLTTTDVAMSLMNIDQFFENV